MKKHSHIWALALILTLMTALPAQISIRKSDKQAQRKALTFSVLKKVDQFVRIGPDQSSNIFMGDTSVQTYLPILAKKMGAQLPPEGVPIEIKMSGEWIEATVSKTRVIKGLGIDSLLVEYLKKHL